MACRLPKRAVEYTPVTRGYNSIGGNAVLLLQASIYDFPKYYDLAFGSDWKAEFDFLLACFARHARRRVRCLFEPACGTGRLLVKFAQAGYRVLGQDLNRKAVDYCNARLLRHGFRPSVEVADMADFRLTRPADAAFNMINSFRHLSSEAQAEAHLQCVAAALGPGGLYILGITLTPAGKSSCDGESWSAHRGYLAINSHVRSIAIDHRRRQERVSTTYDIYTPTRSAQIVGESLFRTYSARQFQRLLARIPALELVACYDFAYDIERPVRMDRRSEDVVCVLRRI